MYRYNEVEMEGEVAVPPEFAALPAELGLSAFLTPSMAESSFSTGTVDDE
jgi:hypothetical protein